jgi:hypothetical protein
MTIEALYPSRRHPQRNNPLLRRERRRQRLIVAAALAFSAVGAVALRLTPNEASAESRPEIAPRAALVTPHPHHHIRMIPLYHVPPEQAGGILAYQN